MSFTGTEVTEVLDHCYRSCSCTDLEGHVPLLVKYLSWDCPGLVFEVITVLSGLRSRQESFMGGKDLQQK